MRDACVLPWFKGTEDTMVSVLYSDRSGTLWAGTTGNGVLRWDGQGGWSHVVTEGPAFQGFITCILEDREGSIWIGGVNGGLTRLKRRLVTVLRLPPIARDAYTQSLYPAHDGSMWIGTVGAGVFRCRAGQFEHFGEAEGLTGLHVNAVLEDSRTNCWVGTRGGLFFFEGGRFHAVEGLGEKGGWILSLFEDRQHRLWLGAYGGLACVASGQVTWYAAPEGLVHPQIRAMVEDSQGRLWVATAYGWLYCLENGRISHYSKADGLESELLVGLASDADGSLWIAAHDKGVIRLRNGRFSTFTAREGLAFSAASHLINDPQGGLWIGSERGLMRVGKADLNSYIPGQDRPLACLALTESDGMFNQMCSGGTQPAMAWDAEGRLWVPNMKAIAIVDPKNIPYLPSARVVVEEVVVAGQPQAMDVTSSLRMPLEKGEIEFRYTTLNLSSPENARFRFKLEGWDSRWVEAGNFRMARYHALPAGDYQFRVMACGRDGEWHEALAPLKLLIVPRFWQTGWFRLALGGIGLGSVGGGGLLAARRKARRELERMERAHALERERARIARDIHDELGAGLAQIGLLADLGLSTPSDRNEVQRNFTDIAQRSRSTVAALDEIVWAINPRNDNLPRLADYLCRLAEECFERSPIRCHKEVPADLPPVAIHAEVRHNLTLAVKEAMANTLKHSRASEAWLRLVWQDSRLEISFQDNGCGFDSAQLAGEGNGLRNQKTRLGAIAGTLEIRSAPGQGVYIAFRLSLASRGVCPK